MIPIPVKKIKFAMFFVTRVTFCRFRAVSTPHFRNCQFFEENVDNLAKYPENPTK